MLRIFYTVRGASNNSAIIANIAIIAKVGKYFCPKESFLINMEGDNS